MNAADALAGQHPLSIFIIAGEPSGDALGGSLMTALIHQHPDTINFFGVGGEHMTAVGMTSLFPIEDLAVMGIVEVIPKISSLLSRINQTVKAIERLNPDVVVTIDAPDFCFRVLKKLRKRGMETPFIHYVAPTVWAWRPGRAKKIAKFLDRILCFLPFEPPYFERVGLPATFVGHPVVESDLGTGDGAGFRARHSIDMNAPVLCVLPGSRSGELKRLLPVFGETVTKLEAQLPGLQVVVPSVAHLEQTIRDATVRWTVPVTIVKGPEKSDAFAAANVALAASGTVALELAKAGLPHVIGYQLNALTTFVIKRVVKTRFANLINIILDREVIPEFLLENCTAENLNDAVMRLFTQETSRNNQNAASLEALKQLGLGTLSPGEQAARAVLETIKQEPKL